MDVLVKAMMEENPGLGELQARRSIEMRNTLARRVVRANRDRWVAA